MLLKADEWNKRQGETAATSTALEKIAKRFQERITSGIFELSVPLETRLGKSLVIHSKYITNQKLQVNMFQGRNTSFGLAQPRTAIWKVRRRNCSNT